MTILKNNFYVGQSVYCEPVDKMIEVRKIFDNVENTKLTYGLSNDKSADKFLIVDESVLYESKEAYEAELNEIRVGDEFYYMDIDTLAKHKCLEISEFEYIVIGEGCDDRENPLHPVHCFKTKDQLLQAVKKAVEECE